MACFTLHAKSTRIRGLSFSITREACSRMGSPSCITGEPDIVKEPENPPDATKSISGPPWKTADEAAPSSVHAWPSEMSRPRRIAFVPFYDLTKPGLENEYSKLM